MRFTRMPLGPAGGLKICVHLTVQEDNGRIGTPRTPQKKTLYAGISSNGAVIKDITALLLRISFALRRNEYLFMRNGVDVAMIENRFCVSKNKIYIAFDVTLLEILAGWNTGTAITFARAAGGKECVLRP